jgi:uncharacterized membrane protein YdfJ with MMPL/SSD domain
MQEWHGSCYMSHGVKQAHAEEVMAMRENREKWVELCAQAANEQDSQKLMALIKQIITLLDAKQGRLIERDSQCFLKSERTD